MATGPIRVDISAGVDRSPGLFFIEYSQTDPVLNLAGTRLRKLVQSVIQKSVHAVLECLFQCMDSWFADAFAEQLL